jgi:uncharacterized protein
MTGGQRSERLRKKVAFLSSREAHGSARPVEARETRMSWVFLSDDTVYKLKKPVTFRYLDFGSIARRRFFCKEEVRLNRRLAADTYRGTVPLRLDSTGRFRIGGQSGRIVDWLVEMKRLPQADMLDERLNAGTVERGDVQPVAARLAEFYAGCRPATRNASAYLRRLAEEQRINRQVLLRPRFALGPKAAVPLDTADSMLARLAPSIERRIVAGAIVEGHGDLRPEHVCLIDPPQIIDCLEFNLSMRLVDPYDEVNYLAMECDMLGAPWIRGVLLAALDGRLPGWPDPEMLALYGGLRALLRARLSILHLDERPIRHPGKWRPLALRYIEQAARELVSPPCPEIPRSARSRGGA